MTPEISQILELIITAVALVVPTVGLTDTWKWLAARVEALVPFAGGLGARVVSWAVALVVVFAASALGYADAGTAVELWALLSLLSNAVYSRLYARGDDPA